LLMIAIVDEHYYYSKARCIAKAFEHAILSRPFRAFGLLIVLGTQGCTLSRPKISLQVLEYFLL
jgi:hypothetical protein